MSEIWNECSVWSRSVAKTASDNFNWTWKQDYIPWDLCVLHVTYNKGY